MRCSVDFTLQDLLSTFDGECCDVVTQYVTQTQCFCSGLMARRLDDSLRLLGCMTLRVFDYLGSTALGINNAFLCFFMCISKLYLDTLFGKSQFCMTTISSCAM